jgi:oxepin-CoA hydrolase/3-oxo-5,6-dehydrosuberyl-CoA semialdehyde dehydrogenase
MKFIEFDLEKIETTIRALSANTQALWGSMSAAQMVQHLIDIAKISNGSIQVEFANKPENLPKLRHILYKEVPFPKEFAAPKQVEHLISQNKSEELAKIELLKSELLKEFEKMEAHLNDGKKVTNAVFGPLDLEDWKWFHRKHISHHLAQFGLWEY